MSQATLRTVRLELVPLSPEHQDFIFQLDSDPEVMKYIGYGRPFDANESNMVYKHLLETAASDSGPGLGCWAGFAGGDFVGWWVLAPNESNSKRAEFGLRVLPKFWGKGYAKEGTRQLLKHGFQDLGLDEVYGDTMAVNAGSRAVLAACGLRHIRTYHNKYDTPPPGIEKGEVEYRITKDEWISLDPGRK
ncbi:GNAT domain-containing protein [Xylariales sp. AK1849]|nr:GNAT domain-containing protein [Xylariales sp. AK1849]